jgi:hypothetical protein
MLLFLDDITPKQGYRSAARFCPTDPLFGSEISGNWPDWAETQCGTSAMLSVAVAKRHAKTVIAAGFAPFF